MGHVHVSFRSSLVKIFGPDSENNSVCHTRYLLYRVRSGAFLLHTEIYRYDKGDLTRMGVCIVRSHYPLLTVRLLCSRVIVN